MPVELIDLRTPGVAALRAEGAATFVAGALARHGVVTVVALPVPSRASRERARAALGRLIEVYVPSSGAASAAYEPPLRAEVEVALPEVGSGTVTHHVLRTSSCSASSTRKPAAPTPRTRSARSSSG